MHPIGFIHDASIILAREDSTSEAMSAIRFYMESLPLERWFEATPPLPILADLKGPGDNLADIEETEVDAVAPSWYREDLDHIWDIPAQV